MQGGRWSGQRCSAGTGAVPVGWWSQQCQCRVLGIGTLAPYVPSTPKQQQGSEQAGKRTSSMEEGGREAREHGLCAYDIRENSRAQSV